MTLRRASVAGRTVAWTEDGTGPPLLLVASMLVRAATYRPLTRVLARDWRVLCLELPGCGAAARIGHDWRVDEYAEVAADFLDVAGVGRVVAVGHSNSGPVAMALARRRPERVAGLVVADGVGAMPRDGLPRLLAARAVDAVLEPWLTVRGTPHVVSNLVRHRARFLGQIRMAARADVLSDAREVRVPTLLVWGAWDHTEPVRCGERLRARIGGASLAVVPGSHDCLVTHPEHFAATLRRWHAAVVAAPRVHHVELR